MSVTFTDKKDGKDPKKVKDILPLFSYNLYLVLEDSLLIGQLIAEIWWWRFWSKVWVVLEVDNKDTRTTSIM